MTRIEKLCAEGIRRIGSPEKGFRYQRADRKKLTHADLARIDELVIPPAWTDVCINGSTGGRVQAVGKDAAGRWQYLYHNNHVKLRERRKFERLLEFVETLPAMRKTISRHLRLRGLPRERVMASILRILSMSFMRPGSQIYANENGSYGIATLRPKHVTVKGDKVVFDFPGKSGKQQHRELLDRSVARVVRELLRHPGRDVFKYQDESGAFIDVKRRHINAYIKEVSERNFTAKDFRTWAGTLICACALARAAAEVNGNKAIRKRKLVAAIKATAEALGNTPAVCRDSYICPAIMTCFEEDRVIDGHFESLQEVISYRGVKLHPAEKSLLKLLKDQSVGARRNGSRGR
jgi:DNA topoisomerase-1